MPNYWSGTNCRASGSAQIGEPIFAAELWLNNERVRRWDAPDPDVLPLSMSLKVMFDSSHFANGTNIEVRFIVWGLFTGPHEVRSSPDPIVVNKLMMFEDPAPPTPDPVPVVQNLMASLNYNLYPQDGATWTKFVYFGVLYGSNAVFAAGHGTQAHHTAPVSLGMTATQYETERTAINGSGLPPFNSTPYPPVNFCHLVACNCGATSAFKAVLYPYYMGWGGLYLEDQALIAYTCFTSQNHRARNSELVWAKLALGWTAYYTREWIKNQWLPEHASEIPMSDVNNPPVWRDMTIADLALYCGPDGGAMRLKSVYTGNHALPTSPSSPWVRPL